MPPVQHVSHMAPLRPERVPNTYSPPGEDCSGQLAQIAADHSMHGGLKPVHVAVQFSPELPDESSTPPHDPQVRSANAIAARHAGITVDMHKMQA